MAVIDEKIIEANTIADGYSGDPADVDQFIVVPTTDGLIDFSVISKDIFAVTRMLPLPIRLINGIHRGPERGYGCIHILRGHAWGLAKYNYWSVQDYVDDVAREFDAVYRGRKNRWIIIMQKRSDVPVDRLLVLELSACRTYYSVVTGWPHGIRRPIAGVLIARKKEKDGKLVWESEAPVAQMNPSSSFRKKG